jgi:hypothetical protein
MEHLLVKMEALVEDREITQEPLEEVELQVKAMLVVMYPLMLLLIEVLEVAAPARQVPMDIPVLAREVPV